MVRNAGKFGKAKRGGGRHFSREVSDRRGMAARSDDDSSSEESSSEEESESEDDTPPPGQGRVGELPPSGSEDEGEEDVSKGVANLSTSSTSRARGQPLSAEEVARARAERRKAKKGGAGPKMGRPGELPSDDSDDGDDGQDAVTKANTNANAGAQRSIKDMSKQQRQPPQLSRREREERDKKAARERYMKMHLAGKTDEAKADLSRLAEIRKQREAAAAQRKAEQEARDEASKAALEKSGRKKAGK